jgi:hypothetical protein
MFEDQPKEKYIVRAENPDTGKRLSFSFSSREEAYVKMTQLKQAKFKAVEVTISE